MPKTYLVTGGSGFIGSALVRRLVKKGNAVRVLDNHSRGSVSRLKELSGKIEFIEADIRDGAAVDRAAKGVDAICHLAFVNGTEFFYSKPDLVLDVGVKGMVNVMEASRKHGIKELILASSSEVYQLPPRVPTDETAPLAVPDPWNPRFSYGAAKIISEMMAIHGAIFKRLLIFRPHNVYGPEMGWEHVIPQFILRMKKLCAGPGGGALRFPVQGTGEETRAFVYIDDFTDGLMLAMERGEPKGIYHIGTDDETKIRDLAALVAGYFKRTIDIVPQAGAQGSVKRRCPDISKLVALGYCPKVSLREGVLRTVEWYDKNSDKAPSESRQS